MPRRSPDASSPRLWSPTEVSTEPVPNLERFTPADPELPGGLGHRPARRPHELDCVPLVLLQVPLRVLASHLALLPLGSHISVSRCPRSREGFTRPPLPQRRHPPRRLPGQSVSWPPADVDRRFGMPADRSLRPDPPGPERRSCLPPANSPGRSASGEVTTSTPGGS